MTTQVLDSTDTVSAEGLAFSSGLLPSEGYAIATTVGMRDIPQMELRNYIAPEDPGSSPLDEQSSVFVRTSLVWREGMLPVFLPYRFEKDHERFIPLQKWEGVVLEVGPETFSARLADLTRSSPEEEAEFPVDEISNADWALLQPGGVFYWTIGYSNDRFGQRKRESRIRFRRLPAWTAEEIEGARREADDIAKRLGWK